MNLLARLFRFLIGRRTLRSRDPTVGRMPLPSARRSEPLTKPVAEQMRERVDEIGLILQVLRRRTPSTISLHRHRLQLINERAALCARLKDCP